MCNTFYFIHHFWCFWTFFFFFFFCFVYGFCFCFSFSLVQSEPSCVGICTFIYKYNLVCSWTRSIRLVLLPQIEMKWNELNASEVASPKCAPIHRLAKKTLAKMEIDYSFHLQSSSRYFPPERPRTDAHTSKCLQWKSLDSFQLAKGTDTPGPLVNEFCKRRFKLIAYNSVCIVDSAAIDSFRWGIWFL